MKALKELSLFCWHPYSNRRWSLRLRRSQIHRQRCSHQTSLTRYKTLNEPPVATPSDVLRCRPRPLLVLASSCSHLIPSQISWSIERSFIRFERNSLARWFQLHEIHFAYGITNYWKQTPSLTCYNGPWSDESVNHAFKHQTRRKLKVSSVPVSV